MAMTSPVSTTASPSALNERLLEVLKDAVGRSTSARSLSEKLGHSHNYVRRLFSGQIPLQFSTLLDMLQQLGLPPRIFFDQVFEGIATTDPVAVLRFYREGDGLPRDPFLDEVGPRIKALAKRPVDPDTDVESRRAELDQLEEQRFEDRDGVKVRLELIIREILEQTAAVESAVPNRHLADLALAGAVWATVQRTKALHDSSCDMYVLVIPIAQQSRDSWVLASALKRASYLLRNLDAAEAGLSFLQTAQDLFVLHGDLLRVGQVLVDRGILLAHLGRDLEAFGLFEASLKILPITATQARASAYSSMAFNCLERDELVQAHGFIRKARELYKPGSTDHVFAQILATEARIAGKLGLFDEAEVAFKNAIEAYERGGNAGYVAVVGLDLAGLYLQQGKTAALAVLADEMFTILRVLRSNRIMDAVLMEFIRTAKWGELSEDFLAAARKRLEGAASQSRKKSFA